MLVLNRAYVPSHRRTLSSGRVITVPAYFTKVVKKPDLSGPQRRRKQAAPVSSAYAKQDPEKLALRLVAHVDDGTMSHEQAHANLAELERRANAGHQLFHGGDHAWSPEQTHDFIKTARTALALHARQAQKQARKRPVVSKKPPKPAPATQETERQKPSPGAAEGALPGFPVTGTTSRVITATNQVARDLGRKDIETRFAVVEADQLIHSFDPRYPQALQPRLERRPGVIDPATETTVTRLLQHMDFESLTTSRQASQGAPIITDGKYSISGSGRIEALKRMHRQGGQQAADYTQFLQDEADNLGLDAGKIAAMKQPVLTRVITTPLKQDQLAAFADEANQRETQAPGPISVAVGDAKRLTAEVLGQLQANEEGVVDLLSRANDGFRQAVLAQVIPHSEHGQVLTQGQWTADGVARLRRMVFARAYGNTPALERLAGSEQAERRNLGNALLAAAPAFVRLKTGIDQGHLHPRDMTPDLMQAANKLVSLSAQGETVQNWLNQSALFDEGLSPLAKDLVLVLDEPRFKRSAKAVTELLHTYAEGVHALGDPGQLGMFGAQAVPSMAAILQESVTRVEQGDGTNQQGLFGRLAA